jgi:hypothetical protein
MNRPISLTLIIMVFLTPVASCFEIKEFKEPIEGYTKTEMMDVDQVTGPQMARFIAKFKGIRVITEDSKVSYSLCVKVYLAEPPRLKISEVIFLVDGERTTLKKYDYLYTDSDILMTDMKMEVMFCNTDELLMRRLAEGKDVQFKIKGKHYFINGTFPTGLKKQFREFCDYCGI